VEERWPGRLRPLPGPGGGGCLASTAAPLAERNAIAAAMFRAWWYPFSHYGVIHGDPHLGNYTVFATGPVPAAAGINLLDYGCIRTFSTPVVQGVIDLSHALLRNQRAVLVHADEAWRFGGLPSERC